MLNTEQTLTNPESMSWRDKYARATILKVFTKLPYGEMVVKENGVLVDVFGQKGADLHAEVNILDTRVYSRLLFGGSVASGETFAEGMWETTNLTNVIRIFARNMSMLDNWEGKMKWLSQPLRKIAHLANRNSKQQSKQNIAAHYDLGNKLYSRFLDQSMMYSAAVYPQSNTDLAEAQNFKLKTICDKLQLSADDHLLEIGTGWGGLAVYAAKHYGCRVTTTTISDEQHEYAAEWISSENLDDRITLLKQDYRLLEGQYDKLVSIEMIEAVGKEYLPTFFKQCAHLVKQSGIMLLQAITINDKRYDSYQNGVDFIQKHIFPGGFLPSQLAINEHLKKYTDFMIRDLHDIGLDYAKTIQAWHDRFLANTDELLQDGYDERFMRLWRYYFSYCEGGFLERTISTVQLVLSKPNYLQAIAR